MIPKKKKKLVTLNISSSPKAIFESSTDDEKPLNISESLPKTKQSTDLILDPLDDSPIIVNDIQDKNPNKSLKIDPQNIADTPKPILTKIETDINEHKTTKQKPNSQFGSSTGKLQKVVNKQKKIFDFGQITNLPKTDSNTHYAVIQQIYSYFNKKKPIPLILTVIHQSAGNLYEAVHRLAQEAYDFDENDYDFTFSSISATEDDLNHYFI